MRNENNYIVWSAIATVLFKIQKLLQYADDLQPLFVAFGRHLLENVRQSVLWDPAPNESE